MITDKQIIDFAQENDLSFTNNFAVAIYMLRSGKLISGEEKGNEGYGRTLDHNCLAGMMKSSPEQDDHAWDKFLLSSGLVMLVPETKRALIARDQNLTKIQKQKIRENGFTISY